MPKLRLSYSKASTFLSCRKAYYWSYIEELIPKEKSTALQVGDIVHRLLHLHALGELRAETIVNLDELVGRLNTENTDELNVEVAYEAARLVSGYLTKYQNDPLSFMSPELPMELELPNFILVARIDSLARPKSGLLWRVEHKTAAKADSAYLGGLKAGLQGSIYDFIVEELLKEKLSGTIYNLLIKTQTPDYKRSYTMINRKAIERALQTLEGVARDINLGDFYPSSKCHTFNRTCDYLTLCEHDSPSTRKAFFKKKEET